MAAMLVVGGVPVAPDKPGDNNNDNRGTAKKQIFLKDLDSYFSAELNP